MVINGRVPPVVSKLPQGTKQSSEIFKRFCVSCFFFFPSLSRLAAGLRTPLAVPGPYPGAFGMLPHPAGMNGELAGAAGAAAYAAGLHNMSPQMSAAAAAAVAAYGRSPMVSGKGDSCFWQNDFSYLFTSICCITWSR